MTFLEKMVVNVLLVLPEGLTATALCEVIKNQNIPEHSAQSLIRSMLDNGSIVLGEKLNLVVSDKIKSATNFHISLKSKKMQLLIPLPISIMKANQ